jgi:hypothetical protein
MSSREAALEAGSTPHHFWRANFTMQNLMDTIEGILAPPPSKQTRASLQRHRKSVPASGKSSTKNIADNADNKDEYFAHWAGRYSMPGG